jgi:hypothetical protein
MIVFAQMHSGYAVRMSHAAGSAAAAAAAAAAAVATAVAAADAAAAPPAAVLSREEKVCACARKAGRPIVARTSSCVVPAQRSDRPAVQLPT